MEQIKKFLDYTNEKYEIYEYEGHLEANTKSIKFLFVEPHEGNKNKWLFRASTIAAFDRWANSSAIELFFDSEKELCDYLYNHRLEIYEELLSYLSIEYFELEKDYDELEEMR